MENIIQYKGHYILPQFFVGRGGVRSVGIATTLPDSAVPPAARLRGFLTVASAKKYITRYGKRPRIERVL